MASQTVEERLEQLESKVELLLTDKAEKERCILWWERHFGAFKDSPHYDEAMRLGAEYRRSQPTAADECDDSNVPA